MHIIVGISSGKEYARGSEEDCFRMLKEQFPGVKYNGKFTQDPGNNRWKNNKQIYPEPLFIRRAT